MLHRRALSCGPSTTPRLCNTRRACRRASQRPCKRAGKIPLLTTVSAQGAVYLVELCTASRSRRKQRLRTIVALCLRLSKHLEWVCSTELNHLLTTVEKAVRSSAADLVSGCFCHGRRAVQQSATACNAPFLGTRAESVHAFMYLVVHCTGQVVPGWRHVRKDVAAIVSGACEAAHRPAATQWSHIPSTCSGDIICGIIIAQSLPRRMLPHDQGAPVQRASAVISGACQHDSRTRMVQVSRALRQHQMCRQRRVTTTHRAPSTRRSPSAR